MKVRPTLINNMRKNKSLTRGTNLVSKEFQKLQTDFVQSGWSKKETLKGSYKIRFFVLEIQKIQRIYMKTVSDS
ncbi:hypothetical protein [Streptococcus infantis]|uniref:hypothetical protein n=1 Tax=Streptococcus infantis TaxID=68892 RepID=UPI001F3ED052|nr:hypothetical protein [Streptococcus infantis]